MNKCIIYFQPTPLMTNALLSITYQIIQLKGAIILNTFLTLSGPTTSIDVLTVLHKWITLIPYIYSKDKHEIICEIDKHGVLS